MQPSKNCAWGLWQCAKHCHGDGSKGGHPCSYIDWIRFLQTAIERARVYDKCAAKTGGAKLACQLDKALVNVGALFASQVEGNGRVSTEVDPRLAHDTGVNSPDIC